MQSWCLSTTSWWKQAPSRGWILRYQKSYLDHRDGRQASVIWARPLPSCTRPCTRPLLAGEKTSTEKDSVHAQTQTRTQFYAQPETRTLYMHRHRQGLRTCTNTEPQTRTQYMHRHSHRQGLSTATATDKDSVHEQTQPQRPSTRMHTKNNTATAADSVLTEAKKPQPKGCPEGDCLSLRPYHTLHNSEWEWTLWAFYHKPLLF